MSAIDNARSYDFQTWLIGIMRSFLSGGAAALASLSGAGLAGLSLSQTLKTTGASFVIMGLYRLGEFLTLHGSPDKVDQSLTQAAQSAQATVAAVKQAQAESIKP
jgi:hypothetical protein